MKLLNCSDMAPLASKALDERLALRERWMLAVHLVMCRFCQRYSRQLRFLREVIRLTNGERLADATTHTLSPEARRQITQRLINLG
ncbi:MAG: hypothetical protein HY207_02880 [Nitrospirae bacterium]|nr:hypothetical protein [Nitrospirota bacterium]